MPAITTRAEPAASLAHVGRTMRLKRRRLASVGALLVAFQLTAWAWGHPGHQLVGSLADELIIGTPAAKQVSAILGPSIKNLKTAATWPDCVRDVEHLASGDFKYNAASKYHSPACVPFETPRERARMEDYARRNWSNCPGQDGQPPASCHRQYHFADVAIQHDDYSRHYAGTSERDIVAAINAAVGVLRTGHPATSPISIRDRKESLLMLAHFVGDLHQPLHVGAVYLLDDGRAVDPDALDTPLNPATETRGGNQLEIGDSNLHAEWDEIPGTITLKGLTTGPGQKRRQALLTAARAAPNTPGTVDDWPARWASDTVAVSHAAFAGLRFSRKGALKDTDWVVQFNDSAGYDAAKHDLQQRQLEKAAAHLARMLLAIWP